VPYCFMVYRRNFGSLKPFWQGEALAFPCC